MKRFVLMVTIFCFCLAGSDYAVAGASHYTSGVEGIRAATLPPPNTSVVKLYNVFYNADKLHTNSGSKAPGNFDVSLYAFMGRYIYSSDIQFLGGNLVFDVVVPLMYTDVSYRGIGAASYSDNRWGLGDVLIEPLLIGWHGERWDALTGISIFAPTGSFDRDEPASPGQGLWTFMYDLGGTYFFDTEKTWSASVLARYQIHTEQEDTDITPGHHLSFEWGLGKKFNSFDIGLAGYCSWQVTDDSGPGSTSYREEAYAVGPEIGYTFESGIGVQLRSLWEVENKNKAQGNITTLSFTYAF